MFFVFVAACSLGPAETGHSVLLAQSRPIPRMTDGHPDFNGYWKGMRNTVPVGNIAKDLPGTLPEVDAFIGLDQVTKVAPIIAAIFARDRSETDAPVSFSRQTFTWACMGALQSPDGGGKIRTAAVVIGACRL